MKVVLYIFLFLTDILDFAVDKDTMFLSCRGELRRYSKEGKLEYRFDLPKSYVTSFDLDTLSRSIYILDSINSEIVGFRYDGEELFRLKLPVSCYSVHYAGGNKLLLAGRTIPEPETYFLNTDSLKFVSLQIPNHPENKRRAPNFYNQARKGVHYSQAVEIPLFTSSRTQDGIYLKYLFNDTIYQVSEKRMEACMIVNMGKERVALKNKNKNVLKKNGHFCILDFWVTPHYWIVKYALNYNDFILTNLAWFNKDRQLIEADLAFYIPNQIYEIGMNGKEKLFMNQQNNSFYSITSSIEKDPSPREKNFPEELRPSLKSGNLLLIKATFSDKDGSRELAGATVRR